MKKIIAVALIASLFVSCSKNDDDEKTQEEIVAMPVLPVKIKSSNGYTEVFSYKNNNELAEIINSDGREVYTYEGDNIVKTDFYEGNKIVQTMQYSYTNNRLTKTVMNYDGSNKITVEYEWTSDSHFKYKKTFSPATSDTETGEGEVINGNITKLSYTIKSQDGYVNSSESTFQHEGFKNPFVNIKGYNKINLLYSYVGYNNIITSSSSTKFTRNGVTETINSTSINSYTYSSNNFPVTKTTKYTNYPGSTTTGTTEYQYNQ